MATLGVNIDHVATIRQARRTIEPDPVTAAALAELGGADAITVHLREDRRHIQDRDLEVLRRTVQVKLNLEAAIAPASTEGVPTSYSRSGASCSTQPAKDASGSDGAPVMAGMRGLITASTRRDAAIAIRVNSTAMPSEQCPRSSGGPIWTMVVSKLPDPRRWAANPA